MTKDDVEDYIREKMAEPTEITAEDLSPPVCAQCGDELDGPPVIWDIPEHENKSVVWRYRLCSESCKDTAMRTGGDDQMPYADPERLTPDEREALE